MSTSDVSPTVTTNRPVSKPSYGLAMLHYTLDQGPLCPKAEATWGDINVLQVCYGQLLADHSALQAENREKTQELKRQQLTCTQALKEQLKHANTIKTLQKEIEELEQDMSDMQVLQEQELRSQAFLALCAQKSRDEFEARIAEMKNAHREATGKLEAAYVEISDRKVSASRVELPALTCLNAG